MLPSAKMIQKRLKEKNIQICINRLYKVVKEISFKYKTVKENRKVFIERNEIRASRAHYLRTVKDSLELSDDSVSIPPVVVSSSSDENSDSSDLSDGSEWAAFIAYMHVMNLYLFVIMFIYESNKLCDRRMLYLFCLWPYWKTHNKICFNVCVKHSKHIHMTRHETGGVWIRVDLKSFYENFHSQVQLKLTLFSRSYTHLSKLK